MRWLVRVFASAVVRRLAYAVVVIALAYFGLGRAHAAEADLPCRPAANCDQGRALTAATDADAYRSAMAPNAARCELKQGPTHNASARLYNSQFVCYNATGGGLGGLYVNYFYGPTCAQRPSAVTPFFPPSGSLRCISGCEVAYRDNGDDTTTYATTGKTCDKKPDCAASGKNMVWNAALGVCQPVEPECPPGKVHVGNACTDEQPCPDGMALVNGSCKKKDEECPAGMTRSPLGNCIPGDGQCAAGEARGKDGTCKKDKDGDGSPDEEEEPDPENPGEPGEKPADEFSGGDTCTAPPSCSGSPIMCGQARIQWRIDCNTRRNNNVSGGQCTQAGMPVCTGEKCNAMEYTQLIMQWRSACAAEKLLTKSGESTGGVDNDANKNGVADALEGTGQGTAIGDNAADVASAKKWGIGLSTNMLDTENMLGGGSCPPPPSITIMGTTVSGADMPYFCQVAAILRVLILGFGAYYAIQILLGRVF